MRLRDIPSFIRTTDLDDVALAFTLRTMECHRTVPSAIIFHTFERLETNVLSTPSGRCRHSLGRRRKTRWSDPTLPRLSGLA
jgi:hypothetical protein